MGMMERLRSWWNPAFVDGEWPVVNFNGNTYPLGLNQTLLGNEEKPNPGYTGLVQWAYHTNAVVYACVQVRLQLFAEARFQYRRMAKGRPGDLFGDRSLAILEQPWPNGTTGDLLAGMLLDYDLAGDSFTVRLGNRVARMRPDWTVVITDIDAWEPAAEIVGYAYQPGGPGYGRKPILFDVSQVAHWSNREPLSPFRGMSWINSVVREIAADIGMTEHKRAFLVNGATPNLVVSLDPAISKAAYDQWVETFQKGHRGARNAYETMFLGGGAKAEVVGKDLQQLDFKLVQGAGETRIAAAAGVPPVIVGLSEGLQAATYSNYSQARRRFADGTMRPLWRDACAALSSIITVPGGAELWYDDRDIAFLQDDMKDRAEILKSHMTTIAEGVRSGYEPDSVVSAVTSGDLTKLTHTGLYSVQLQPPMPEEPEPEPTEPAAEPDESPEEETPGRSASWDVDDIYFGRSAVSESLGILRTMAEREQPAPVVNITTPDVNVHPADVNVTIEAGAVSAPEVTFAEGALRVDVAASDVTVEAPQVHVDRDAIRLTEYVPTRTVIDRDPETNEILGTHEEPYEG